VQRHSLLAAALALVAAILAARLLSRSPRLPMRSPAGDYVTVTDLPAYWWN
jgi:hypothetical protein